MLKQLNVMSSMSVLFHLERYLVVIKKHYSVSFIMFLFLHLSANISSQMKFPLRKLTSQEKGFRKKF